MLVYVRFLATNTSKQIGIQLLCLCLSLFKFKYTF